ncbi:MAG TPA: hypothetical protein VIJ20_13440 [Solirubrobacteraceae bacterium]
MWPFVAVGVVLASTWFVFATKMRPGYDPYGWLVWGHQTLHLSLNTDGAPSWKALTFLFTLPFSLAGRGAMWLWMIVAVAGALSGAVLAAHIAYRLAAPCRGRRYAAVVGAAFAAIGVLCLDGYSHLVLIANADPLVVALCLAVIDAHLSGRPRLAFALLVLTALGRPEAWPFVGLYALWAWRAIPSMRVLLLVGVALIPALSFGIPALTSKSWLSAANLDLNSVNALHGNKFTGVIGRFLGLYHLPVWLAVLVTLILAVARRDRVALALAGTAFLWVAIEIAFALHGFSAVSRYLIEPAAVLVALAGAGVGWVLAGTPRIARVSSGVGVLAVAILGVALVPTLRTQARTLHGNIDDAHRYAAQDNSLHAVIARDGGAARIRACGQPVTDLGHQSDLAWEIGLNVGDIGFRPGKAIDSGKPIVFFRMHDNSWQVLPFHLLASDRATCERLKTTIAF